MTKAEQIAQDYNQVFIAEAGKCFISQDSKGNYNVFHTNTGICQGLFSSPVNAYKHAEAI